ncbi:hypothetical protein LCGC14_2993170 [marine sediment metagenome]|uniref:Uncharacterized protein n=1 Tax=marine sediment metagenome TaxID=412755 RepID=A0A0F8XQU3_9ZZZZ
MVEEEKEAGVSAFTCARCVVCMVPFPTFKPALTADEKAARTVRRKEREERKAAIADGTYVQPKSRQDLGFGRGWHKKVRFKTGANGKTEYYSKGEKITRKEYDRLGRGLRKADKEKKQSSFGRGWHFKAVFIAANGDRYEKGKLVKKA